MGYRPAVPGLLRLTEDSNATVAQSAREALAAIAARGGSSRIAHALFRSPPDVRRRRLDELGRLDRAAAERIERLMRQEELMSLEDGESLADDSAEVRATEEGVEWEILTGPSPRDRPPPGSGGPGGDPR
jgi:hypothetical protein